MRLFRCDRCKKEYTFNEYMIDDGKLGMRNPNESALIVELPVDLCDDCRKDFENWFRQPMVDKAFEEAHKKAHSHENGEVTVLGLEDGRVICPVCGEVFDMIITRWVPRSDTSSVVTTITIENCPKCNARLNTQHINYININKKENKDNEQQSDAEET